MSDLQKVLAESLVAESKISEQGGFERLAQAILGAKFTRNDLVNVLGVALANAYDDDTVVVIEESVADYLIASGIVEVDDE